MTNKHHVSLTVNGMKRDGVVEGRRLLSDFIRDDLALTGTHIGCEHGVLWRLYNPHQWRGGALVPDVRSPG